MLDAVAERAAKLCDANDAYVVRVEGDALWLHRAGRSSDQAGALLKVAFDLVIIDSPAFFTDQVLAALPPGAGFEPLMTLYLTEHTPPEEIVGLYLRAQNLEQVRRVDEAVPMYEQAVAAGFDAAGPYDRLIAIYRAREAHAEVQRVATAALRWVRTFDDKKAWYEAMRSGAEQAAREQPDPRGAEF